MKRTAWLTLLAAATLTACDRAAPEQQIVNDAAAALGGRARILAVKTIVIEAERHQLLGGVRAAHRYEFADLRRRRL